MSNMSGAQMIDNERTRQIEVEGWNAAHDDKHQNGEMAAAAMPYLHLVCAQVYPEQYKTFEEQADEAADYGWPWDREWWKPSTDPIRNLVKAGALIAAEIDRLNRLADKQASNG